MNKKEILSEIDDLKKKIAECKDDKTAIELQISLMDLLKKSFEDKDFLYKLLQKKK